LEVGSWHPAKIAQPYARESGLIVCTGRKGLDRDFAYLSHLPICLSVNRGFCPPPCRAFFALAFIIGYLFYLSFPFAGQTCTSPIKTVAVENYSRTVFCPLSPTLPICLYLYLYFSVYMHLFFLRQSILCVCRFGVVFPIFPFVTLRCYFGSVKVGNYVVDYFSC
jgi:hypothetical protein